MSDSVAAGTMIRPDVELLRPLGEGGMGEVWLARHLRLDTEVAVKLIRAARWRADPVSRARFEKEAQAAAKIDSPHVVRVFDYGITEQGMPFIVMERLRGEGLDEHLRRAGTMAVPELAVVVRQVARALHAAHALGIVHRDIKPGNIFLTAVPDGTFVKVLDFGIAKEVALLARETALAPTDAALAAGLTQAGAVVGTPLYMSPEQLDDAARVDPRSDIWSLGIVAYQALTGRFPFSGRSLAELHAAVRQHHRHPAKTLNPSLPPAVDEWLDRALAFDPDRRFATVMEAAAAFDAVVPSAGAAAYAPTLGQPMVTGPPMATPVAQLPTLPGGGPSGSPAPTSRAPWLIAIASLTVALVAVLVVVWSTRSEPDEGEPPSGGIKGATLDDGLMLKRADAVARGLVDEAGGDAKKAIRLMINAAVGQLETKRGDSMRTYIHRSGGMKVRDSESSKASTFDATAVDLSRAQDVVTKAEKRLQGRVVQLVLQPCNDTLCRPKVGDGTPLWCMHVGEDTAWICYDQKARFLYVHRS